MTLRDRQIVGLINQLVKRSLVEITFMESHQTAGESLWLDRQDRAAFRRVERSATVQPNEDDGLPPPPSPARLSSA